MKALLAVVFSVLLSAAAYADNNGNNGNNNGANQDHTCQGGHNCNEGGGSGQQEQEQAQSQTQGQIQNQVLNSQNKNHNKNISSAQSTSEAMSHSSSVNESVATGGTSNADLDSATNVEIGDAIQNTIYEYEAVAQSVSSLNLPYCADGAGAGDKSGSFNVGGLAYICELQMAMQITLASVPAELEAAKNCKDDPEQVQIHLARAHDALNRVSHMSRKAFEYIDKREHTAAAGSFFRDVWWILGLIALAL